MNLTDLFENSKAKPQHSVGTKKQETGIPGNVPVEKIPGKQDLLKGRGRTYYEGGRYGSRNPDTMSAGDYDRYQQDQMDFDRRDFKRREHEAEWEQEKAYSEKLAARDAGTWYIRINGKILKDKQGQPYTFSGKAAANRAAVTMMAKPFNAGKEFLLTTSAADKI